MSIQDKLIDYIEDLMGLDIKISSWGNTDRLPVFMKKKYEIHNAEFLNKKFLIMIYRGNDEAPLTSVKNHIKLLSKHIDNSSNVVYVCSEMSNYGRHSMIKEKIPFIVVGLQLYVPFLGIAFQERIEEKYSIVDSKGSYKGEKAPEKLVSTAQALFFELITRGTAGRTQMEIASEIGISKIAVSRGFSLLEDLGIIHSEKAGVKNIHGFVNTGKSIWDGIEKYLINPIVKEVYIHKKFLDKFKSKSIYYSGETALSRVSMLSYPDIDTYSVYSRDWNNLKNRPQILPLAADDSAKIEIWSHPIPLFGNEIHPVALYLALKDSKDERIQSYLNDLIDEYMWDSIVSTDAGIEILK